MNTRYNGVLSAYNTHRKTCDSVGIPYSTDTALLRVVNDILSYMNKQHVPILVLLDLSAAFDTVDHVILLHQVKTSFGITDTALAWFSSYLSGRSQCMSVNGERLDCYPLPFGLFVRVRVSDPYSSVPMPASCSRSSSCTCPTHTLLLTILRFILPSTQMTPLVK